MGKSETGRATYLLHVSVNWVHDDASLQRTHKCILAITDACDGVSCTFDRRERNDCRCSVEQRTSYAWKGNFQSTSL